MRKLLFIFFVATTSALFAQTENAEPATMVNAIANIFNAGGAIMWVLLITSMIGLTFALERFVGLRRSVHLPNDLLSEIYWLRENRSLDQAREHAQKSNSTLGRVLSTILSHNDNSRQEIEQAVEDELARVLWDERRNVRPIGIAATTAPLLGLLGTVIGMIDAFRQAATTGMDNPANFAGGIYQALYTTAFGLMISIFLLLIYHYLRGRTEQLVRTIEDQTVQFIHHEFYRENPLMVQAEAA